MQKETIKKAGDIIMHRDGKKVALIHRFINDDWSFPKGHIEAGESPLIACLREVKEETGLDVKVIRGLPDMDYENDLGERINMAMYLVVAEGDDFILEHPRDILEWIRTDEIGNILSYDNLKNYYQDILPVLNSIDFSNTKY